MGAIFGILNKDGRQINEEHVKMMKNRLTNYGRDAQDIYIYENIAIGCCLNKIGQHIQHELPIHKSVNEKMMIAADAQIYKRDELINALQLNNSELITNNQLIVAAYKKWGKDFPKYVNGDFTIAIWESEQKQLLLVRDHLGVRPLYFFQNDSVFVFSTDYRAIIALDFVPQKIDESVLYKCMTNQIYFQTDSTFFEEIKKLPPAHILSIGNESTVLCKYWTPGSGRKIHFQTEEEYFTALYEVVLNAIKARINETDVKIGAQISGGLDSAVINILANRELVKKNKHLSLLFSWAPSFQVFARQPRDERNFIEEICSRENLQCSYYDIAKELTYEDLDKVTAVDRGGISPFKQELEQMHAEGIKLVLSGWGGDQGISHRANLFELFMNGCYRYFLKEAFTLSKGSMLKFVKIIINNTIMQLCRPFHYLGTIHTSEGSVVTKKFHQLMKKSNKRDILYFNIDPVKHLESGNIQTRTELSAWLGADYNVQYVFPFLDFHVVDFAMSIPRHLYFKHGINRYVFRKAFEGILPKDLCYYVPKDDVARLTYAREKLQNDEIETVILGRIQKKNMFEKYIDFSNVRDLLKQMKKQGSIQAKLQLRRKLEICYNIQKIIEEAKQR